MHLLHSHCAVAVHLRQSSSPFHFNPKPKVNLPNRTDPHQPARDRVINFGKHKGSMLGSLPSSYLRWVSRNLRARDYEEWARLADQVLSDSVYLDRIEWESAERVLSGEGLRSCRSDSPASEFLEISRRFGWDVSDRDGWARVNFGLLGTSHGGRIPRVKGETRVQEMGNEWKVENFDGETGSEKPVKENEKNEVGLGRKDREMRYSKMVNEKKGEIFGGETRNAGKGSIEKQRLFGNQRKKNDLSRKTEERGLGNIGERESWEKEMGMISDKDFTRVTGVLSQGFRFIVQEEDLGMNKRMERREKRRLKREQQLEMLRREVGMQEDKSERSDDESIFSKRSLGNLEVLNPFPGRCALLNKINKKDKEID